MQDTEEPLDFNPPNPTSLNGSLGAGSADDLMDIVENISPGAP